MNRELTLREKVLLLILIVVSTLDEQQREERADGITRERTQRNVDIAVLHGHVDQPQEAAHEPASDEIDG